MSLLAFFAVCFLAASSGAIFQPGDWYKSLHKPSWTPPNWAFPVVWSILFCMMAVAGWLVWREVGWSAPIALFGVQLTLNALWSAIFFGMRRMDLALVEVGLLWLAIAATVALFAQVSLLASALLVPYLIWVTIAAALNWSVLRMNPGVVRTA